MSRRETAVVWAVAILVVAGWVWLTASEGALGIARNDDWSYLRNAFALADTGQLTVSGWVQMTLIGQLVLAVPIIALAGHSITALQLLVAALGIVLIVASYGVGRLLGPVWVAAVSAGTVGLGPLVGTLTVSFMTDVPAAAFQLLTLWLGTRGLQRAKPGLLIAAGVSGLLAFSIREYAIVAIAAVWLIAVIGTGRRGRPLNRAFLLAWTAAMAVLGVAIALWRAGQVTTTSNPLEINAQGLFSGSALPLTIGLLCLGALALVHPLRAVRRAWASSRTLATIAALGLAAALYVSRGRVLGNYAAIEGGYTQVIRGIPMPAVPEGLWFTTLLFGLLATVSLLAVLVTALASSALFRPGPIRGMRERAGIDPAVGTAVAFLTLSLALLVLLPSIARTALFDRYLIALIPVAAALALRSARLQGVLWPARWWPAPLVQVLAFILTSVSIVSGTAALDGARWETARELSTRFGVAPGNIDGGFDWFGSHPAGVPMPNPALPHWTWWTTNPSDRAVCATVMFADPGIDPQAAGPDPTTEILDEIEIRAPLTQSRTIRVYRGPDDCPAVAR